MKKAYVFPGQGAQFPGMGKDLFDSNEAARAMFREADRTLGFGISEIMFEGSAEDLKATKVTQPAIFIHSTVLAACLDDFNPDMVAGHSLGEFSALAAAGAMSFPDGLKLVQIRADQMQECCESHPGLMAAIIGLDEKTIGDVCSKADGVVVPANFNCDGQVVISGEKDAVLQACEALKAAGAKRALPLQVSGAFHSPLMESARAELAKAIDRTPFKAPVCPVYQNVCATAQMDPASIRKNLLSQLTSPVLWTASVKNMLADGARFFMELGPGAVLQGLIKRIATGAEVEICGKSTIL